MRTAILFMAVFGILLVDNAAWAIPPLEQLYPGQDVRVTTESDGTWQAATVWRAAAEAPHMVLPDQFPLVSRASKAPMKTSAGAESVIGTSAIVCALIGTFIGGGVGYLIVQADDRTSNFW